MLFLHSVSDLSSPHSPLSYFNIFFSKSRPLEEVDRLLEGSPVKDKAIQCIAEVTDTWVIPLTFVPSIFKLKLFSTSYLIHRFNDLNSALFSKHPEIFPPEVKVSNFKNIPGFNLQKT